MTPPDPLADPPTPDTVTPTAHALQQARHLLSQSQWFRDWPAADLEHILSGSSFREHAKSTLVYRDGSTDELVFLLSGAVWTCLRNERKTVKFGMLYPGALIGLSRLLHQRLPDEPCYEFHAAEPTRLLALPASTLAAHLDHRPQLWRAMAEATIRYQRHCIRLALVFYAGPVKDRLISALYQFGLSAAADAGRAPQQEVAIPQEELATLIQSSRQHVNRALRELESEGLVKLGYKRIEIVDVQALEHRAEARILDRTLSAQLA